MGVVVVRSGTVGMGQLALKAAPISVKEIMEQGVVNMASHFFWCC